MTAAYDQMQADVEAEKEKRKQASLAVIAYANDKMLLNEYARRGEEPFYSQGMLISPFLLDQLRGKPAPAGGEP